MVTLEVQLITRTDLDSKSYLDNVEKLVRQISEVHKLDLGIPSSIAQVDVTIDSCFLIAKREAIVDLVADELAAKISGWRVRDDVKIVFTKRKGGESPEEFVRKVLPTADPEWVEAGQALWQTSHGNDIIEDWPVRLRYIAEVASRYYAIGGNDVAAVFRNVEHLHQFIDSLGPQEKAELLTIAKTVASNADHLYIMDWFNEANDGTMDWPRTKALYFLALLERLREEGVLKANPKINGYVDWNKMGG